MDFFQLRHTPVLRIGREQADEVISIQERGAMWHRLRTAKVAIQEYIAIFYNR